MAHGRKHRNSYPEDTILAKLDWYKLGGETSERQWSDILNILQVQGSRLDRAHIDRWAAILNVSDQLNRAFAEANLS